ncbi:hypothetical protein ES702_07037 [subsurface metagenome]
MCRYSLRIDCAFPYSQIYCFGHYVVCVQVSAMQGGAQGEINTLKFSSVFFAVYQSFRSPLRNVVKVLDESFFITKLMLTKVK